jgi:hypothetical protein
VNTEKQIIDGIARALFVCAWADKQERLAEMGRKHSNPGPGGDWMDIAPKTPRAARDEALRLVGRLEQLNGAHVLCLLAYAAKADGMNPYADDFDYPADYARLFGHYVAMQSIGHGVSWFDDHAQFDLKTPHIEGMYL